MPALHPRFLSLQSNEWDQTASSCRSAGVSLLHSLYQSQCHWRPGTDWDAQNINYFKAKPVNIPKITILVDHGYHPETISQALQEIYPQILTKIRFERSQNLQAEKAAQGKFGFVPVATRWVVERSNAWMERCKSLVKNFEWTLDNARAKLNLCFIRLMLSA